MEIPSTQEWPADNVSIAVVRDGGVVASAGDLERVYRLASITKPLFAYAVLVAHEEGSLDLGDAGPLEGTTIRHLLAHASGMGPDQPTALSQPERKRIYSNAAFEAIGEMLQRATDMSPSEYMRLGVFEPLGMEQSTLDGSPAKDAESSCADLARFAAELLDPTLISRSTLDEATSPAWPDLDGVLPGFGKQSPNPWGLGFEVRGDKSPHWTGASNSPQTFGHFGQSGTFIWVDPTLDAACVCLTDKDFGPWAIDAWPGFNEAIVSQLTR